jgi:hypothetical protein
MSLTFATCLPRALEDADIPPLARAVLLVAVLLAGFDIGGAAALVAAAEVVVDAEDEPELQPVSTKAHKPAAPAPLAQSTVRRVR